MRLIIAGGRDYQLTEADYAWLDEMFGDEVTEVVSGKSTGADTCGELWAKEWEFPVKPFPAEWDDLTAPMAVIKTRRDGKKYNARAGNDRNRAMAQYADALALFPGGSGSADMLAEANAAGIKVFESPSRRRVGDYG